MREHEVPTHVQAEDRVLLWFTFPQIVAITAVCALSYGAYRYAPVGPSEVRIAIAVLFGLVGVAMIVGKIGGRRLPMVAADLLKYRLGARVYSGPVSQLVRSEAPAPPQPVNKSGPLRLMARKSRRALRRLRRKKRNRQRDRRDGRMPFRPRTWFRKRRKRGGREQRPGHMAEKLESSRRRPRMWWMPVVAAVLVAMAAAMPQAVLADGHDRWKDEIDFKAEEPVDGRRIFVEGLTVYGDRAAVTLRAATDVDIRVRAFGGSQGTALLFWGLARLAKGESIDYSLPLHGPVPSFTVSWTDSLAQAGAHTVKHEQIPHPLPEIAGELCELRMTSLGWTPGTVSGVIESECETAVEELVELQTVAGHESVTETALLEAQVMEIAGTVIATTGGFEVEVPFVPDGETRFRIAASLGEAIHPVTVDVSLEASLRIPIPPLTQLTHHPERTEKVTKTVDIRRPGASDSDTATATAVCEDGTTATATASAYAHVPSATIAKEVTVEVLHKEHVKAEVVEREPLTRSREEMLSLASAVGSDDLFAALSLPEPEPEEPKGEQSPAGGGLREWFERLGWKWPW